MNHFNRFKIVYIQILVALASSIGGELVGMKDLTKAEVADLTWIAWALCICNILGNTGNTIIAIFNPVPASNPPQKPKPDAAVDLALPGAPGK